MNNKLQQQSKKGVIREIAEDDSKKLLEFEIQDRSEFVFKELIRIFAYLGHRNIFKGSDKERKESRQMILELSALVLNALENNPKFRSIKLNEFKSVIDKGCAGVFLEIKHVSPANVISWIEQFREKYQPKIDQEKRKNQKSLQAAAINPNEEERQINLEQIQALFRYFSNDLNESVYSDFKKFHGNWIGTVLFGKYAGFFPEEYIKTYTKRRDIYEMAKKEAVINIRNFTGKKLEQVIPIVYSYKIYELFKINYQSDEMAESYFKSVINDYHDKN